MSTNFKYQKTQTILKVENIGLSYNGNVILRDVDIEIKDIVRPDCIQGQIVGFVGPSGVGKTQFSEILTGLKQPTINTKEGDEMHLTGSILINNPLTPVKQGMVGLVQQNYPLFEYMTVFGNIKVAVAKSSLTKNEQKDKINFYLETLNLTQHAAKFPAQLSGGQRQRVAIAQQLACSNRILVLDEPFSGLDINMVSKVCGMLQQVSTLDELNTIIIVSHDIPSTVSIADTIWIMGKEKDESTGGFKPGARIVREIDLIERGLTWEPNITQKPEFGEAMREIRAIFPSLG